MRPPSFNQAAPSRTRSKHCSFHPHTPQAALQPRPFCGGGEQLDASGDGVVNHNVRGVYDSHSGFVFVKTTPECG
jgi:hypothetical protein